jgi:lysozyme
LAGEQFIDFMVWLATRNALTPDVRLAGHAPWTLWQYNNRGRLDGIPTEVDQDVFFGTPQQFERFVLGQGNVALEAVKR